MPKLKLIVDNTRNGLIYRICNILPFLKIFQNKMSIEKSRKKEYVLNFLTLKYADYQLTTGEIGLFPLSEAINDVEMLERTNKLNAYYRKIKKIHKSR